MGIWDSLLNTGDGYPLVSGIGNGTGGVNIRVGGHTASYQASGIARYGAFFEGVNGDGSVNPGMQSYGNVGFALTSLTLNDTVWPFGCGQADGVGGGTTNADPPCSLPYGFLRFGLKSANPGAATAFTYTGGLTMTSPASFALGNGAEGDASGSLTLANITVTGTCTGCGGETNPTETGLQKWNQTTSTWSVATYSDVESAEAADPRPGYTEYQVGDGTPLPVVGAGNQATALNSNGVLSRVVNASGANVLTPLVSVVATPASSTAPCNLGDFAQDGTYLYICTALNTWKRTAALSTF